MMTFVKRWQQYWSAPGGRIAVAVLRIAIGSSLLWSIARITSRAATSHSSLYYPHGIWLAFPGRPSTALLAALVLVAWLSTLAFTAGLATRATHAISLIATLALATFEVSNLPTWTHQNVPPLLASLALLGARSGDALSVDAMVRQWRGLPALDVPGGYGWSVRLVQLAVASVFFVAACCKLLGGGPGLGWALSDNLRHQLLMRFDWIHLPRTAAADWILVEPWRYKAFALFNLASQLSPMATMFLMHRPGVRALLGLVWIAEVTALGIVMALWDTHWLPLAAAFVDWDRLARGGPGDAGDASNPRTPRARSLFIAGFLGFYAVQAFALNQRLNIYPFSSYPMFSEVRAKWPYDQHQSYELIGGRIELVAQRALTPAEQRWVDRRIVHRWMWQERDAGALHGKLRGVLDDSRRRFPTAGITGVRLWLVVDRAPAYPAAARLERFDLAILGELDAGGSFCSALGRIDGNRVTTAPSGIDLTGATLIAYRDDLPEPLPVAATHDATGFVLAQPIIYDPEYIVAVAGGRPWLIAQRASRGF